MKKITYCKIENCGRRNHGNRLCSLHYDRFARHGDVFYGEPNFRYHHAYIKKGEDECWPWIKGLTQDGYGKFKANKKTYIASRYGWEIINGIIPDNLLVCHTCDNPLCQNPKHWFLGTQKENTLDKVKKGRLIVNPYKDLKTGRFTFKS